ncbi:MAG: DUF1315 family protein [Gammaproteobacteria bacterium]|nr:DUF1315 family protein [Gammaproteobacteria bacterium]
MTDTPRRRAPESQRPKDFASAVASLDRATYENLRRALELGRWPDGRTLQARQREICMEAVLNWEAVHLPPEQRTGYIEPKACSDAPLPDRIRILGEG